MKILTGYLKGRALPFVPSADLRPTTDKVRKAMFDVLQDFIPGKRALDLYSGTGAMGLEALSQGAAFVCFVERNAARVRNIESALKRWKLEESSEVMRLDVLHALTRLGLGKESFDLVFIDPPYKENNGAETLNALDEAGIVADGGFVVVECGKREELPEKTKRFSVIRDKRYGQSRVVIYATPRPGRP